ncbi:MAG: LD-carboxypeptidase [Nanoarchaeota archaeon]|nr:LD-carboxypeptidase [Nanoarchaeota archaeon]MBU1321492.1 LD-carboxypeptidase [Nanoarchaeota archaeon]MBU1597376.1 LD-carboxypeptidase [Nanoarchaeota archaeon]MBU2441211.1 LD-carboxypeptidase [Nanoarchaeota archaeon]
MKTCQLIAPSRKISKKKLEQAVKNLKALGFHAIYDKNILDRDCYHAGTVSRRVEEIHKAFQNKKVNFIFSVTGGYGCIELLPFLNYDLIKSNAKPLVGYSDITGLLLGLFKKTKIPLIHSPMPGSKYFSLKNKYLKQLDDCLNGKKHAIRINSKNIVRKQFFRGNIVGGNLRILISLIGTPYELDTNNKVLFLEDANERPAAIYNMLLHLELSGKLKNIKALILGKMNQCGKYKTLLMKFLKRLNVPIICDLDLGHSQNMISIRLGSKITFDTENSCLIFN